MAYTNVTRLLGLNSGIDTESLVTQLMNAESMKLNSHKRNLIKLSWKQEAYRDVYSKLKSFQSKHLDLRVSNTLRLPSTYKAKTTTIKTASGQDSGAVSVNAGSKDGSYTIKVDQLAQADLYESDAKFRKEITSEQVFDVGNIIKGDSYSITLGSTTKNISFKAGDTIEIDDGDGNVITGKLAFQKIDPDDENSAEVIGIVTGTDPNTQFTKLTEDQFVEIFNNKLETAFGTEANGEQKVGAKLTSDGRFSLFTNGYHSNFSVDNETALSGLGLEPTSTGNFDTDRTLKDIFGDDLPASEWNFTINGKSFVIGEDKKLSDLMKEIEEADIGVTLNFDDYNGVFRLESNETGVANKIEMSGEFLTKNLAFGNTAKREAADAIATISDGSNIVTVTRESNDFELFGVDWSLKETTGGEALKVNITRDADTIIDTIKGFVESYNELIGGLNGLVNERRAKSEGGNYYDPLLEEERAELTETQLTQWDTKAKQGILYRDSIVSGITSQLRSMLYQPVEMEDGSTLALFQIGVTTSSDWKEGGKLVVNEDELRAAIEEHGDKIATLFTKTSTSDDSGVKMAESGLAVRMNNLINTETGTYGPIAQKAGIVGGLTENNNEIYKQLVKENQTINKMLDMLTRKETYYYSMFSRMEAAIAESNNQMSYLQSITGGA